MNLLPLVWVCLAVGVALLPTGGGRRLGGAGLVPLGLALAAWQVGRSSGAGLPRGFVVVNLGLVLLGGTLLAVAAARGRRRADLASSAASRREPDFRPAGSPVAGRAWLIGYAAGMLAAAIGPHLGLVFAGVALAVWCDWGLRGDTVRAGPPAEPALTTLLLLGCYWFLATIAGSEGLWVSAIPLLPLSPAAGQVVALPLLILVWLVARLWPLPARGLDGLTAPLAVALLVRVGVPAGVGGLEHWQPLVFPAAVVGIYAAAIARDGPMLARAGAVLGLVSLDPPAILGSAVLLMVGLALEWLGRAGGNLGGRGRVVVRAAIAAGAAWGGLAVASGGLRSEVVYTVLAAGGVALPFILRPPRPAAGGSRLPT
jgi:hypothetical protein